MVSAMVVEKQKLDNKVKEMKDLVQVGAVVQSQLSVAAQHHAAGSQTDTFFFNQMADQSIKNLEDQQDEYNFKLNKGEERCSDREEKSDKTPTHSFTPDSSENEMNGMTAKELEKEKLAMGRMCLELKAKRQVSKQTRGSRLNTEPGADLLLRLVGRRESVIGQLQKDFLPVL